MRTPRPQTIPHVSVVPPQNSWIGNTLYWMYEKRKLHFREIEVAWQPSLHLSWIEEWKESKALTMEYKMRAICRKQWYQVAREERRTNLGRLLVPRDGCNKTAAIETKMLNRNGTGRDDALVHLIKTLAPHCNDSFPEDLSMAENLNCISKPALRMNAGIANVNAWKSQTLYNAKSYPTGELKNSTWKKRKKYRMHQCVDNCNRTKERPSTNIPCDIVLHDECPMQSSLSCETTHAIVDTHSPSKTSPCCLCSN